MAFPIKWFSSAMAPTMLLSTGSAGAAHTVTPGALISLLKACLVTGFGIKTVSAINYDAANAKIVVTIPSGHTYQRYQVIELSGANESGFNGEFRVMKVTTTTVECALDNGIPTASSATGSLSAKIPGLGWAVAFEDAGTYRCIFKRTDAAATEYMLYVDNSAWSGWNSSNGHLAKIKRVTGVTDINTMTVVDEWRWPCSHNYATADWFLVGDSKFFYFAPKFALAGLMELDAFGDFNSVMVGDKHNNLALYHYSLTTDSVDWAYPYGPYSNAGVLNDASHKAIARAYHGLPGLSAAKYMSDNIGGVVGAGLPIAAITVNPADSGFYWSEKAKLYDSSSFRGYMPGLRIPYASPAEFDGTVQVGINGDMTLCVMCAANASGGAAPIAALFGFDIVGPWQ